MQEAHDIRHTVSGYFARAHLQNGLRLGLDEQNLLNYASLSPALLQQQGARLPPRQLARLLYRIMKDCDDEFLGLASEPCRFGVFPMLCERLIHTSNLREAMQETQRFYGLITRALRFELEETQNDVRVTIVLDQPELDQNHVLIELLLLIWHRFPSWLIGQVIPLTQVQLAYPTPQHAEEYRLLFPAPREFNQSHNTLVWPKEVLELPVHRNMDQLKRYLSQVPLLWFRKQRFADFQTERVIQLLEQTEDFHHTTLEDIAEQLHMTSRTLRRKLTAEGSKFQQLKDDLRRDQAIYWLSQEGVSITETGQKIGYTETASFIRAFRGWTGLSPGQYKKGLRDK
ncbi:AraC family transcriptional regulator [Pseudomaricurvus sp.]|uniref:AraC family transcriptional regulator n=1 Tax=Pseudomaricurvus sp. TaxID=2004510 RepID=UPI003F6B66E7